MLVSHTPWLFRGWSLGPFDVFDRPDARAFVILKPAAAG
jgi:hypothetical protein